MLLKTACLLLIATIIPPDWSPGVPRPPLSVPKVLPPHRGAPVAAKSLKQDLKELESLIDFRERDVDRLSELIKDLEDKQADAELIAVWRRAATSTRSRLE